MKILYKISFAAFVLLFVVLSDSSFPQWSNNPAVNLAVSDTTGEQGLSKMAVAPDGSSYYSWFDNRGGEYAVYMQKLNAQGEKLWGNNGILISNHPQNTSLVDYDLIADHEGNAILAFTDIRTGDLNVFAYKINPQGTQLWGTDGIALSSTSDFQANPKLLETTDNNIVVVWINAASPYKVAMQKLSPEGTKLWGSAPIFYGSGTTQNYNYPVPVSSDNNGVVIVHTAYTGSFISAPTYIYAQKFNSSGTPLWGSISIPVQNLGTLSVNQQPRVKSDGSGGAFVAWYDDRDNNSIFSAFLQHLKHDGTMAFPENGSEASTLSTMNHTYPTIAYLGNTDEAYLFWQEQNDLQSQAGLYGQKFSPTGDRLWTDNGKVFQSVSSNSHFGPWAISSDNAIYNFFMEGNASGLQDKLFAFKLDHEGNFMWGGNFVTMSDATPQKLHSNYAQRSDGVLIASWTDTRNDGGGIYAQDINPDGTLGNENTPVELTAFTAAVSGKTVNLQWATATETNNKGFSVERFTDSKWNEIAFINGKGTTTEKQSYSYTDKELKPGKYSYRLKQIDFDGSFSYSAVVEAEITAVTKFSLSQNYPNPFNPATKIKFSVPAQGNVQLKVYNVLGREVASLVNEQKQAGEYEVEFNASNFSSGIYFYKLIAGSYIETRKMILMK